MKQAGTEGKKEPPIPKRYTIHELYTEVVRSRYTVDELRRGLFRSGLADTDVNYICRRLKEMNLGTL